MMHMFPWVSQNRPRLSLAHILLTAAVLGFCVTPLASARAITILSRLYVAAGGFTSGACDSWANACELRYALTVAATDGTDNQIWVEQGTYTPTAGSDQTASFGLLDGTSLYGGFGGTESLLSQRDPRTHVTTLSGEIGNPSTTTDNSYQVVDGSGVNATAVLDGFTIARGNANGIAGYSNGGGIYILNGSPTLNNLILAADSADNDGGGVFSEGGSPALSNVTFSFNQAGTRGGAMYAGGGASLTDVTFYQNSVAADGGAMFIEADPSGNPALVNVTFWDNQATVSGGALLIQGISGPADPTLTNVSFLSNQSGSFGGAIDNVGLSGGSANPVLSNVILWGDAAANLSSGPEMYDTGTAAPSISYSVVQGDCSSILGATCGVGDYATDPKLGPLQNNGGTTQTMALLEGSSAIDRGDDANCPSNDQRGVSRPRGAHCDIGAYERVPARASFGSGYITNTGVFRPSSGGWFVKNLLATTFGLSGDDPLPFDFDGNATSDIAVYRPSTSAWYVKNQFATTFGLPGDIPVPGDYNGDELADVAVFRPSTGAWYVRNQFSAIFGLPGDIPVPGDYNGDGITDLAVFRPSTNSWYLRNQSATIYGLSGDIPVPGDYNGDGTTDIAVFRPSTNGWYVKSQFSTIYGLSGDYPLPAPDTNADGDPYQ